MQPLRQSTAVTVKLGPFLNATDGVTAETGLTIAQADVRLSKAGGDMAAKTDATTCTHDELGVYDCPLDATDTATVGRLRIDVAAAGALPVWQEYTVLPAAVYDALVSGTDRLGVDLQEVTAGAITDAALAADLDSYGARVEIIDDDGAETPADRYCVTWMRNQEMLTTGVTSPKIQVVALADGTDLVAETDLTAVGSTGAYQYVETTNRIVDGAAYMVLVTATIAEATRTWPHFIGRDSVAA